MAANIPSWDCSVSKNIRGRILYFQHPDGSSVTLILSRGKYWMINKEIQEEAFFMVRPEEGRLIDLEYTTGGYRWRAIGPKRSASDASSEKSKKNFDGFDRGSSSNA